MSKRSPFYELSLPEDPHYDPYGVAYFPEDPGLAKALNSYGPVNAWARPVAELRDGDYFDFLANNQAATLVSERLQRFLDSHRAAEDPVQWLPVRVARGNEVRDYHVLRLARDLEPLDPQATSWIGHGYPRIPVLRREMVGRHQVLRIHPGGYSFVVSEHVQKLLKSEFPRCFTYRPLAAA